ncbi:MAG: PKD domain-containing protein [Cytophagaceae bacterium]|nr:PKD domain-containing protein [Cytophagaceae bacterium]
MKSNLGFGLFNKNQITLKNLILIFTLIVPYLTYSQDKCGFDSIHQNLLKTNFEYSQEFVSRNTELNELKINDYKSYKSKINETNIFIIPIVIHIMNNGEEIGIGTNIDDITIFNSIDYLNRVYNGTYPGIVGVGDIQIQFELAKRTPSNDCTNGIERINASSIPNYSQFGVKSNASISGNGCSDIDLKNFARWNPNDYLNIWVVNRIDNGSIVGYSHLPSQSVSINQDGIVIVSSHLFSSVLTHEMGHALDLLHIFDSLFECIFPIIECSNSGDYICDTDPVTEHSECKSSDEINSCTNNPFQENTELNIMGYTLCRRLFTNGQKIRMQESMNLSRRASLIRSNNLALKSPFADLNIIGQSVNSLNIPAGDRPIVSFIEKNNGNIPAGQNYVSFHLSSDNILTPGQSGDKWIGDFLVSSVGAQSNSSQFSTQITIPTITTPGLYYLFFSADGNQNINECNESNNYSTVIINVLNTSCTIPSIPTIGSATSISNTFFTANWHSSNNADTYLLNVSTSSNFNPGTFVPGFENIEVNGISKIVPGVFCNTVYYYRVRAKRNCGSTSNYSQYSIVTTSTCGGGSSPINDNCNDAVSLTPNNICNNISGNLNEATSSGIAKPNCDNFINPAMKDIWYKFSSNTTGAFSINVTALTGFDAVTTLYDGCNGNELNCSDILGSPNSIISANLTLGHNYYIRIYDYGITDPSNPNFNICVTSPASCNYPSPPNVNSPTYIGQNSFQANWNFVSEASKYYMDVSTNPEFTTFFGTYNNMLVGTGSGYNISNLNCNTIYYYRIRSENSCGQSLNSTINSITTNSCNCSQIPESYVGMITHYRINAGNTIQWNATGSNNPDYFEWTFPGGNPSVSNETSPIIQYNTPGIYGVTLRAHNNCGWSNINIQNSMAYVLEPCSGPPVPPLAKTGTTYPGSFIANWEHSQGAIFYKIDWAYNSNFTSYFISDLFTGEGNHNQWTTGECGKYSLYY